MFNPIKVYKEKYPWGSKPDIVVGKSVEFLPQGCTVFDVGIGDGRNAIALGNKGFTVHGIDPIQEAIDSLNNNVVGAHLTDLVSGEVADILTYEFDQKYPAIICNFVLHFIPKDEFHNVIEKMKKALEFGGVLAISDFTQEGPMYKPGSGKYWMKSAELKELFRGYEILYYDERIQGSRSGHQQNTARIIARKL